MVTPPFNRIAAYASIMILGFAAPSVFAQGQTPAADPPEMTLAAAVGLALRNNRDIKTAHVAREAQKFAVKVQENQFEPQASISAAATATRRRQETFDTSDSGSDQLTSVIDQLNYATSLAPVVTLDTPFGTSYALQLNNSFMRTIDRDGGTGNNRQFTTNPEFSVVQPLLRGLGRGINTANLEVARLNEKLGQLALRDTVAQVITAIVTTYWQVVLSREQLEISRSGLVRAREIQAINLTLVETGRLAESEIVQTEADVAEQEFDLAVAENSYARAKLDLLALLDLPEFVDFQPQEPATAVRVNVPLMAALDLALANRPEIARATVSVALAETSLLVAKDGRKWDLSLIGTVGSNSTRRHFGDAVKGVNRDNHSLSIGMELIIPINDLSLEGAVVDARRDVRTARLELSETEQVIQIEVQNAVRDVTANYRQMQLAETARTLAEQQLAIEEDKFSLGRSSNFQVLSFQDTLRSSQLNEVSALISYLSAVAALDLALGLTLATWEVETTAESARTAVDDTSSLPLLVLPPGHLDRP